MRTLVEFIRDNKPLIMDRWFAAVCTLPSARSLPAPVIRDHIPDILDSLVEAIEHDDHTSVPLGGLPKLHAALRVREGYDLRQVIAEYRVLRRVIDELYAERGDLSAESRPKMAPLRVMHGALDAAISDAVDQFSVDTDRSREMFIGMLGHDLRDPLNTIAFSMESVLARHRDELPESVLKAIVRSSMTAKRMEAMIRDLLDFAHGRLGPGLPVVPVALDAVPLVDETVRELAHAHPDRDVRFVVNDEPANFEVEWDGDRIAQAVSNLVSNALLHGADPVVVSVADEGGQVRIEVRNRGEIPPQLLPRLFDPFTHHGRDRRHETPTDVRTDRRRGHLGLGLYIVRQIAEAHGGVVAARNADGNAIFHMLLPRKASREPHAA